MTKEMCLEAVKRDGCVIKHIPKEKMTKEMCLKAVKQDGWAINHIPEEKITEEILLEAEISKKDDSIPF